MHIHYHITHTLAHKEKIEFVNQRQVQRLIYSYPFLQSLPIASITRNS